MDYFKDYMEDFKKDPHYDSDLEGFAEIGEKLCSANDIQVEEVNKDADGYSIYVSSPSVDYGAWMDVYERDDDWICGWNKDIFYLDCWQDRLDKFLQGYCNADGDCIIYDLFSSIAMLEVYSREDE